MHLHKVNAAPATLVYYMNFPHARRQSLFNHPSHNLHWSTTRHASQNQNIAAASYAKWHLSSRARSFTWVEQAHSRFLTINQISRNPDRDIWHFNWTLSAFPPGSQHANDMDSDIDVAETFNTVFLLLGRCVLTAFHTMAKTIAAYGESLLLFILGPKSSGILAFVVINGTISVTAAKIMRQARKAYIYTLKFHFKVCDQ